MKKTKRILMALLSFCLMGNVVLADEFNGFVYTINSKGNVVIKGYNGNIGVDGLLKFPIIKEGVNHNISSSFIDGVANIAAIKWVDLTNVNTISEGALTYSSKYDEDDETYVNKGFVNLEKITIGADNVFNSGAVSGAPIKTITFVDVVSTVTSSMIAPFKSTLTTVELPVSCEAIGASAFEGCGKLTKIKLGQVASIGDNAFYNSGLKTVSSDYVLTIGANAFAYCSALTSATFSDAETIGSYAFSNSGLTSFTIAEDVNKIPEGMFYDCKRLASITFGDVEEIGANAFAYTGLNGTIDLPSNLTKIGANAFAYTNIAGANFYSDPTGVNSAFGGSDVLTLYIDNTQLFSNQNTYDKVIYQRTKNGNYGAIVLPFDFEKGNNTYYEFTHFDNEGMHFYEVESPEANTPYLYTGNDASISSQGAYKTNALSDLKSEEMDGGWYAHGVYEDHTTNHIKDEYYKWAISGGQLKWFKDLNIKPYRAYWACSSANTGVANAKVLVHSRNGETTSINMTEIDGLANMVPMYYDLTGRRVLEPQAGNLYIVNGKKVIF